MPISLRKYAVLVKNENMIKIKMLLSTVPFLASQAMGQVAAVKSAESASKMPAFVLDQSIERTVVDSNSASFSQVYAISLDATWKLTEANSVKVSAGFSKDFDRDQELQSTNVLTTLSHSFTDVLPAGYKLSSTLLGYLPTNSDDTVYDSFQGTLGFATSIAYSFANHSNTYLNRLETSFSTRVNRFFYQYDTNKDLTYNNIFAWRNALGVSYAILKELKLSLSVYNDTVWKADYDRSDDNLSSSQELAYQVTEKIEVAVGHKYKDRTYGYNGLSNNINFYDVDTSTMYVSGAVSF